MFSLAAQHIYTTTFVTLVGLQNDHKDIMKEIEKGLHKLHAETKEESQQTQQETEDMDSQPSTSAAIGARVGPETFAKVDRVDPGSPAALAVSKWQTDGHDFLSSSDHFSPRE